ncbi:MAG: hypothetical protein QGG40_16610, partial [Myxococcota bacterium]|nr:hypothetical protein [Myxococcota bacterium]
MKGVWLLLLVSAGVGSAFATDYTPREQRSIERGRTSMVELAKALRAKLGEAMDEGGATLAFDVCGSAAQTKQVVIAQRTGVSVGRASLRLRNSDSVGPPWVVEWLVAQAEAGDGTVEGFERVDNVD